MKGYGYVRGYPDLHRPEGDVMDLVTYNPKKAPPEWVLAQLRRLHSEFADRLGEKPSGAICIALRPERRDSDDTYYAVIQMQPETRSSAASRIGYRMVAVFTVVEEFQAFFEKLGVPSPYGLFYDSVDWEAIARERRAEVDVQSKKARPGPAGLRDHLDREGVGASARTISITATEGKHDLPHMLQLIESEPFDPDRTVVLGMYEPLTVLTERPITWIDVTFKAPPTKPVRAASTIGKSAMGEPDYLRVLDGRIFGGYHEVESVLERVRQGSISRRDFDAGRRDQVLEALEQLRYLIRQRKAISPHSSMDEISEKIEQTWQDLEQGDLAKRAPLQRHRGQQDQHLGFWNTESGGLKWWVYGGYGVLVILAGLLSWFYFFGFPTVAGSHEHTGTAPRGRNALSKPKASKKFPSDSQNGPDPEDQGGNAGDSDISGN